MISREEWLERELRYARAAVRLKPGDRRTARKMLLDYDDLHRMSQDKIDRLNAAGLWVQSERPIGSRKSYYPLRRKMFAQRAVVFGIVSEEEAKEATQHYTRNHGPGGLIEREDLKAWDQYNPGVEGGER